MTIIQKPNPLHVTLLYCFGISTVLYPPLAQYVQPLLLLSFVGIASCVFFGIFFMRRTVPQSKLFIVVNVLMVIYSFWTLVAILHGNEPRYISQDSFGFVIYLLMPVLYVFIRMYALEHAVHRVILNLCTFISVATLLIIVWYYTPSGLAGPSPSLFINAVLKSYNLNWTIDNNDGIVGMYTFTAHFLLLGIGLVFYDYFKTGKNHHLYLVLLYSIGVLGDGHRALVVSLVLLLLLLSPLILRFCSARRLCMVSFVVLVPLMYTVIANMEWILGRFSFTESDPSTLERILQTPALLDMIMQNPILGSGFGSFASVIRSQERPFYYEVDFLATIMKLGLLGSLLYFGVYLYMLVVALRHGARLGYILFSVGVAFLFYMGTNGGTAMSPDSAIFHMYFFIFITLSIARALPGTIMHGRPLRQSSATL